MDLGPIHFPKPSNGQSFIMVKSRAPPWEKQCFGSVEFSLSICYYKRHFPSSVWNPHWVSACAEPLTPYDLEQEAPPTPTPPPLWFTPHTYSVADRSLSTNRYCRLNVAWPGGGQATLGSGGGVSARRRSTASPKSRRPLCFQIGNRLPSAANDRPFSGWQIWRGQNACRVVMKYSATERCRALPVAEGECESALLCGRQADKERARGRQRLAGHTKHLVTDPSGCVTTLHWAACVWEPRVVTRSVFTADLVHTSGIPASSCPH